MHRQVFLNSLFSLVLGASSVSPLISIQHPTVASDNLRDGREGVLPSTPPFHPAPHGPAHRHMQDGSVRLAKWRRKIRVSPDLALLTQRSSSGSAPSHLVPI